MADRNVVVIAGGDAVHAGAAPALRDLADRTSTGMFNTWTAKGLFPWDHPAHLGTIGLQDGDVALAGLEAFDEVILCGVGDDELPRTALSAAGVSWRDVLPADIGNERLPARDRPTPRPALYEQLAAVCGALYADDSLPLNPARAAADLAAALPAGGVVCGDAGRAGFWLGRTFPTRELASVQLPSRQAPGFAAAQAALVRRLGRFSVAVVDAIDSATESVLARASNLVVEIWSQSDRLATTNDRIGRLLEAHRAGGVHVIELRLRFEAVDDLVAVAGAPRWHP